MECESNAVKSLFYAQDLKMHGAVVFRGFDISKDKATFGQAGKRMKRDAGDEGPAKQRVYETGLLPELLLSVSKGSLNPKP